MALFVKFVSDYPLHQIIFFRGIIAVILFGGYYKFKGLSLKPNNLKFNLIRSTLGATGVFTYYYAISQINLADAVILNKLSPFFVIIISAIFLKEKIRKHQVLTLIIALFGAVLVIKPSGDFALLGSLSGLASAITAGSAYVVVRYLRSYDRPQTIVFIFSLVTVIISFTLMLIKGYVIPPMHDLLILISIGVFAMTAQTIMTFAYGYASASKISIYSFGNIIFSIIFSIMFFGVIPDLLSFLGATLIITAGYINYSIENRQSES
jgi:drug/metabolite transporter (DMT)-like permease